MKKKRWILIALSALLLIVSCGKEKETNDTPVPTNTAPAVTVEPQEKLPDMTTPPAAENTPVPSALQTEATVTETPMAFEELPEDTCEPTPNPSNSPLDQMPTPVTTPEYTPRPTENYVFELPEDNS